MFWAARALHWLSQYVCSGLKRLGNQAKGHRDGNRVLELLILHEEFLVSMNHQFVLITSLPFVHTARRSYRLSGPVNNLDMSKF